MSRESGVPPVPFSVLTYAFISIGILLAVIGIFKASTPWFAPGIILLTIGFGVRNFARDREEDS